MKRITGALSIVSLVRTISAKDIHKRSQARLRLGLLGSDEATAAVARTIAGGARPQLERDGVILRGQPSGINPGIFAALDAAVLVVSSPVDVEQVATLLAGPRVPVPTLILERDASVGSENAWAVMARRDPFVQRAVVSDLDSGSVSEAVAKLFSLIPDVRLSAGRQMPGLRGGIARQIIAETSRANGEVAALSNIPNFIPIIGNFMGTSAEFLVLTKTQVTMVFMLAALHGRDVSNRRKVIREIVPVIGSAFAWRTVARELAGWVPLYLGAIPKVLIAYAGTYALGQSAAYYYDEGRIPPKDLMQSYYATALERIKTSRFPKLSLPGRNGSAAAVPEMQIQGTR